MDFSMTITVDPPTAHLMADGELDIFTASQVARRLNDALAAGCRDVVVDVGGVTFVDASALGVFARAYATLVADNGTLGFAATSGSFRRLCELTGLDTVFDLN
jgi:anti-sigma B factor antagonist